MSSSGSSVFASFRLPASISARVGRLDDEDILRLNQAVLVPPPEVLARFTTTVRPVLTRRNANLRESQTLAELRDTLLPKLLSGEVRVREAAELVEAAA